MPDTTVTIVGNLTRAPEVRWTPAGKAVADLGIAVQNRVKNGDEWEDGPGQFYDVTVWEGLAENVGASLQRGDRVMVHGTLRYETWEADDGSTRSKVKIVAEHVGPELRWATARPEKVQKGDRGSSRPQGNRRPAPEPAADPYGDEEPFN